jgi:hypothetical protein
MATMNRWQQSLAVWCGPAFVAVFGPMLTRSHGVGVGHRTERTERTT